MRDASALGENTVRLLGCIFHGGQNHRFPIRPHKISEFASRLRSVIVAVDQLHSTTQQLFRVTATAQLSDRSQSYATAYPTRCSFSGNCLFPPTCHPHFVTFTSLKQRTVLKAFLASQFSSFRWPAQSVLRRQKCSGFVHAQQVSPGSVCPAIAGRCPSESEDICPALYAGSAQAQIGAPGRKSTKPEPLDADAISGTVRSSPLRESEFSIYAAFLGKLIFGCNADRRRLFG